LPDSFCKETAAAIFFQEAALHNMQTFWIGAEETFCRSQVAEGVQVLI